MLSEAKAPRIFGGGSFGVFAPQDDSCTILAVVHCQPSLIRVSRRQCVCSREAGVMPARPPPL